MTVPLDPARLAEAAPGFAITVTKQTPSTNADLATAARAGAPEWTVHTTEHQSAGRGRLDRTFTMPAGSGIAVSVLLRPSDVPPMRWSWLPLVAGLAVLDTVRSLGVDAGIKWPNDVLAGGTRKLCGVLVERVETESGPAAVIGVGLNVTLGRTDLPVETATSLLLEAAESVDRNEILPLLLNRLRFRVEQWQDPHARVELETDFSSACITIGQQVRIERSDGTFYAGLATAVDEAGCLIVDGEPWSAGDVTHLRPQ